MRPTLVRPRGRHWGRWLTVLGVLLSIGLAAGWWAYGRIGRTPGELMDYAELRLQGHTTLGAVALPIFGVLRDALHAPGVVDRRAMRFVVPAPPPLESIGLAAISSLAMLDVPGGKVWRVGPTEALSTIDDAARLARTGDTVEVQSGVYRGDVAVWEQKQLTIRAVGGRARLYADGRSAEGKAIWVIRRGDFTISGFDFIGARVADRNGAGVRFEGGRLRVADCFFWGNQNGILTIDSDPKSELEVVSSEFGYNGDGDGLSHNIYVGRLGRFTMTASYSHHANVGHLLKSRAAISEVAYNRLTDEIGGLASYELDFPDGGDVRVIGNLVQQGPGTENSVMLSYGAESLIHASNRLVVASNTLVNDHPHGGTFVRAAPGTQAVRMANNLLVGRGGVQLPPMGAELNNPHVDWDVFVSAVRQDYRLKGASRSLLFERAGSLQDESPLNEYSHPRRAVSLKQPPSFAGALQRSAEPLPP